MVENSLLDAYQKHHKLRKKFYDGEYTERLETRMGFYEQEGMISKYNQTRQALREFERLEHEFEYAFLKPGKSWNDYNNKFSWQEYFNRADQLLFGEKLPQWVVMEHYGTNDKLLRIVVEELNKNFPQENWILGEIPLYRWRLLNYPGYPICEEDVEDWERNPNVVEEAGNYYEYTARPTKCIYQSAIKQTLEQAKGDLAKLCKVCNAIERARQAYIVEDGVTLDRVGSGGYDLELEVEFCENAEMTFLGRRLTPQEKVMNDTIVREIDTRLQGSQDMALVHARIKDISARLTAFLIKNKLTSATSSQTTSADEEEALGGE